MKKIIAILFALSLALCVAGCGKTDDSLVEATSDNTSIVVENEESTTGFDQITLNGTTLEFPCRVKDMINAVPGVDTLEEDLNTMVEPGDTNFCSIFEYNNTSFGVMNLSDTPVTVKDCYVVMVSTSVSISAPSFTVVYPAGIEYGKEFDKEEAYEVLGEPSSVSENDGSLKYVHYLFKYIIDNQGEYQFSVSVLEDGKVGDVRFIMRPINATTEDGENIVETDTVKTTEETEEIVESEIVEETEVVENTDEVQTYRVKLINVGDSKVMLIKAYRDITGADLSEAKSVADAAPCIALETTDYEEAKVLADAMQAAGAEVEILTEE